MRVFAKSASKETYIEWKIGRDQKYYWELKLKASGGGSTCLLVIPPYEGSRTLQDMYDDIRTTLDMIGADPNIPLLKEQQ